jgi:hypothetical protein
MKIYIVYGSSGEYEDYNWWLVKAFTRKDDAIAFEHKLNTQAFAAGAAFEEYKNWIRAEEARISKALGLKQWHTLELISTPEHKAFREESLRREDAIKATVEDPYYQFQEDEYKTMELELDAHTDL